jgi:23S rRNA (uridine2552-2'-O)-methyltransferase
LPRYQPKDRYYQKAKQDSFAARSVYKLEEIDRRLKLIEPGAKVVDLGCAPGSWLQYLEKAVGSRGAVVGYDLVEPRVTLGPQVRAFATDVFSLTPDRVRADLAAITGEPPETIHADALLSDMAPKTTGIRDADQARTVELVEAALQLALDLLTARGVFAAKVFQGRGFDEVLKTIKTHLTEVKVLKPEATREGSRELFISARGLRRGVTSSDR